MGYRDKPQGNSPLYGGEGLEHKNGVVESPLLPRRISSVKNIRGRWAE